ncbi:MAG: oxygen-independent coproporphyrinogen-3 oxidase [Desulforhopalus sp.]|jgi:oxygen-independent coproporphyrinogen-3 oxidase
MNCLYLHVPFCLRKCHYCSFSSFVGSQELQSEYVNSLKKEVGSLQSAGEKKLLSTLFVGGGTPTCLKVEELGGIIRHCRELFGFEDGAEVSVEANPGTVDGFYFEQLLEAGVNRLSIGVQTFVDSELVRIGRIHSSQLAIEAYSAAKSAGFTNINVDLMYGIPGQTTDSWTDSLAQALQLNPQHMSLYQLMVEEGTRFGHLEERGELDVPDEDEILEMDERTRFMCESEKFIQYETSNYARKGYECRHNINYWENRDYLAAGAAAVSFLDGVREKRCTDVKEYTDKILRGDSVITETERLPLEESFRETVIMGLRMKRGVSLLNLQSRYGLSPTEHYGSTLRSLMDMGMVELTQTHLKITEKGWPLSNRIMAELV